VRGGINASDVQLAKFFDVLQHVIELFLENFRLVFCQIDPRQPCDVRDERGVECRILFGRRFGPRALEEGGLKVGRDFYLAFSPERVDPGNPTYLTKNIPKVVGGIDKASTELAAALYGRVVDRVISVDNTTSPTNVLGSSRCGSKGSGSSGRIPSGVALTTRW